MSRLRKLLTLLLAFTAISGTMVLKADNSKSKWVKLNSPYTPQANEKNIDYLFVVGGYHSIDSGSSIWGTSIYSENRCIGDIMGDIVITYENGLIDKIPLIFGYTMWYYENWKTYKVPFDGKGSDERMTNLLKKSLHLHGAFEGEANCVLKIKVRAEAIKKIAIEDNKQKSGTPVIKGAYLINGEIPDTLNGGEISIDTKKEFFNSYAINSTNPYPEDIKNALNEMRKALYTFEDDYTKEPIPFEYDKDYKGTKVRFSGNNVANIANGVFYYNLKSMTDRIGEDGLFNESYYKAPLFGDSFGTWANDFGAYYNNYYTRNRAFSVLTAFGYKDLADRTVNYANKKMMYFKENNLTIGGVQIPGHYTVTINDPLFYSRILAPGGWPTVYTKSKFGDEYLNIGNQETDGHGLMMIANYNVWKSMGRSSEWVERNWDYINEGAEWILWCFEHPELSFAKKGLLFAESEGGMQQYTLYCNIPCYLGMLCYSEMAEYIGNTEKANEWKECASIIKEGIERGLFIEKTQKWSLAPNKVGFMHDPVISMLSDVYGYDLTAIPQQDWLSYSYNTYEDDIPSVLKYEYFGGESGLGYNHCIITQNALLCDKMSDSTKLVENLTKICYAPRLQNPYIAPEKFSIDSVNGVYRKQGDLGNLYQLSEAMRCYQAIIGINRDAEGVLKIVPRLPESWNLDLTKMPIENSDSTLSLNMTYPKNGVQMAVLTISDEKALDNAKYRFGPFPADTTSCKAQVNGAETNCPLFLSGDSKWAWVEFNPDKVSKIAIVYSNDSDLPSWPTEWPVSFFSNEQKTTHKTNMQTYINIALASFVFVLSIVTSVLWIKQKGKAKRKNLK